MPKRCISDDEIIFDQKKIKIDQNYDLHIDDDFEKKHLISTNSELANFVKRSIEIIRIQRNEIERLTHLLNNINNS